MKTKLMQLIIYECESSRPKSDIGISSTIELANIYSNKKQYSAAVNVLKETTHATNFEPCAELLPQGTNEVKDNKTKKHQQLSSKL